LTPLSNFAAFDGPGFSPLAGAISVYMIIAPLPSIHLKRSFLSSNYNCQQSEYCAVVLSLLLGGYWKVTQLLFRIEILPFH
jgi:hypothetical protein